MSKILHPQPPIDQASLPKGLRVYAIGDIHGRLDLLDRLMAKIVSDSVPNAVRQKLVFLGDYVDRGLQSRQVIDRLIQLQKTSTEVTIFLMGNHEQVMRDLLLEQDESLLLDWLRFGGRETLLSYGIDPMRFARDPVALLDLFSETIPQDHIEFLKFLQSSASFGDYYFCHAGVRPGISLQQQSENDLYWIRNEFIGHTGPFEKIIVHGHTITDQPEILPNRINIDTGAYATGRLTALRLEGSQRIILQTR
jgi:serine/threonine protein phosphatase 1